MFHLEKRFRQLSSDNPTFDFSKSASVTWSSFFVFFFMKSKLSGTDECSVVCFALKKIKKGGGGFSSVCTLRSLRTSFKIKTCFMMFSLLPCRAFRLQSVEYIPKYPRTRYTNRISVCYLTVIGNESGTGRQKYPSTPRSQRQEQYVPFELGPDRENWGVRELWDGGRSGYNLCANACPLGRGERLDFVPWISWRLSSLSRPSLPLPLASVCSH